MNSFKSFLNEKKKMYPMDTTLSRNSTDIELNSSSPSVIRYSIFLQQMSFTQARIGNTRNKGYGNQGSIQMVLCLMAGSSLELDKMRARP